MPTHKRIRRMGWIRWANAEGAQDDENMPDNKAAGGPAFGFFVPCGKVLLGVGDHIKYPAWENAIRVWTITLKNRRSLPGPS